jgi:hypothetical protein
VTPSSHPLDNLFAHEILAARARGHSQRRRRIASKLEMRSNRQSTRLTGANLGDSGAGNTGVPIVTLFVGWWETGAFLASWVLAVDADFLWTEGGFAAVTGAMDAHADGFGYSGKLEVHWGFPFAWFEGEAVFGEEGARFLLLDGAVVGDHGWFGAGSIGLGFGRGCGWRTVAMGKKKVISLLIFPREY